MPLYMVLFSDCGWDLVLIHKGDRSGLGSKNIETHTKERKTTSAERQDGEPAVGVRRGSGAGLGQQS